VHGRPGEEYYGSGTMERVYGPLHPGFCVSVDSKDVKDTCFVTLLEVLIVKELSCSEIVRGRFL